MAMLWAAFFMSLFISTCSQYIYLNEKNDCSSKNENCETISTLVSELKNIQREVHQLRLENIDIRDLQSHYTFLNKLQHEVDELQKENVQLRDLLSNRTSTSELQQEVDELRQGYKEIRSLLTNLTSPRTKINKDCRDLYANCHTQSGVYKVFPFSDDRQVKVYCDMVTEGGGWTAIQKRMNGFVDFDRTWAKYKNGFGNPNDSHWIGNDVIHQLTRGKNSSLYVSITLTNGTKLYELYNQFSVADEANKYRLFLGGPATGTLGDSMLDTGSSNKDLSGMDFTTWDRDNDRRSYYNCAAYENIKGGWWFNSCSSAFLNGPWYPGIWSYPWIPTVKNGREIEETVMMINPL